VGRWCYVGGMYVYGDQHFSNIVIEQIQQAVDNKPSISRNELSRRVCEMLDWRSPNGQLKDMSCRKALADLDNRGILNLPEPNGTYAFNHKSNVEIDLDLSEVECTLSELGDIIVRPVSSRYAKESKIWFALMDQYHYLGSGPLCGAQIRYIIESPTYGYLGGLAFSSASWAIRDRDNHIGWTESARRANMQCLVSNSRFLILPTVNVDNLASHVLGKAIRRLPGDWEERYNIRPVLIETFVNPDRFDGTCYKAANWIDIGKTAGRRDGIPKKIFLYSLCSDWRNILCAEPKIRLGDAPRPESPENWAEEEFGTARLHDNRLKKRLNRIAQDFYNSPLANIPEACGSNAGAVGAYRFFKNDKVTMDVILTAHNEATIERIRQHPVVLAPQDTTTLNYATHLSTEGLGPINRSDNKAIGLILHDTLAFTEDGTPLGVLAAQCWARDPNDKGKKYRRNGLPIEQKESIKWLRSYQKVAEIQKLCPDTMLVSMGDRESDIYELFQEEAKDPLGPKLLIRSAKSRMRKVEIRSTKSGKREVENGLLWDLMKKRDVAGTLQIHLPNSGSRKARDPLIDIHHAKVSLKPPGRLKSSPPIRAWAVYVKEREQETTEATVEWMLLTTVEVNNFEEAKKIVEWYSGRWGIEVYHRTLKSGCRIRDRQLGTADRLETCLGIDMIVAWRIYHLTMLGRETPDMPCTVFFKDIEWKALYSYVNKTQTPPEKPISLRAAIFMLGAMGGHLGRKSDGFPGTQTIWRGLQRLHTATEMYAIFTHQKYSHPMQSGP